MNRADILARIAAHPLGDAPPQMRSAFHDLVCGAGPAIARASTIHAHDHGLTVLPYTPAEAPMVVWFHGGGYVFGSPETHLRAAVYLADTHGLTVLLPRYRLAPEHRWPAQISDALDVLPTGRDIILAGDSAGGHLALVAALQVPGRVRKLLLFSPNTDRTGRSGTREAMDADDPMVDEAGDRTLADLCFHGFPDNSRELSPLLSDLSRLPPTWIEVGTPEVLLDDSRLLYAGALAAGVDVHLEVTEGLLHMGQLWAPDWPLACDSLDRAARFALS